MDDYSHLDGMGLILRRELRVYFENDMYNIHLFIYIVMNKFAASLIIFQPKSRVALIWRIQVQV